MTDCQSLALSPLLHASAQDTETCGYLVLILKERTAHLPHNVLEKHELSVRFSSSAALYIIRCHSPAFLPGPESNRFDDDHEAKVLSTWPESGFSPF